LRHIVQATDSECHSIRYDHRISLTLTIVEIIVLILDRYLRNLRFTINLKECNRVSFAVFIVEECRCAYFFAFYGILAFIVICAFYGILAFYKDRVRIHPQPRDTSSDIITVIAEIFVLNFTRCANIIQWLIILSIASNFHVNILPTLERVEFLIFGLRFVKILPWKIVSPSSSPSPFLIVFNAILLPGLVIAIGFKLVLVVEIAAVVRGKTLPFFKV